jgi:Bacterial regulatory proteins, luxR family
VLHDAVPTPFERARTELCFGEWLRRARRRSEARAHLRAAPWTHSNRWTPPPSPKTVEAHLHRIYVKLGIRSRTELARLLACAQMLD